MARQTSIDVISFLITKCYFTIRKLVLKQGIGIPMGIDPALNWSSLFSYFLSQIKYLQQLICKGYPHAYKFHGTSRFIDNLCTINVNGEFSSSYPKQLVTKLWHQREQFPGDLVTFTEESLNGKFLFLCRDNWG